MYAIRSYYETVLQAFPTFPAKKIDGEFIQDAYLFLECRHYKTIDGFGENCLISAEVVAAYAHPDYIRSSQLDDHRITSYNVCYTKLLRYSG